MQMLSSEIFFDGYEVVHALTHLTSSIFSTGYIDRGSVYYGRVLGGIAFVIATVNKIWELV